MRFKNYVNESKISMTGMQIVKFRQILQSMYGQEKEKKFSTKEANVAFREYDLKDIKSLNKFFKIKKYKDEKHQVGYDEQDKYYYRVALTKTGVQVANSLDAKRKILK